MKVLHPWAPGREDEKAPTWALVQELRNEFQVVSRRVDTSTAYIGFLREEWGYEDVIVLEDDKLPTMAQVLELAACRGAWCVFPYGPLTLADWLERFPFSLGLVKFSKEAQLKVPVKAWRIDRHSSGDRIRIVEDRAIEVPMLERMGRPHVHPTYIVHNHRLGC